MNKNIFFINFLIHLSENEQRKNARFSGGVWPSTGVRSGRSGLAHVLLWHLPVSRSYRKTRILNVYPQYLAHPFRKIMRNSWLFVYLKFIRKCFRLIKFWFIFQREALRILDETTTSNLEFRCVGRMIVFQV